ncbi:MAG: arylesterase [Bacteroidota bacterium]|nr:arylesterase [Bacteroidota bacterium]
MISIMTSFRTFRFTFLFAFLVFCNSCKNETQKATEPSSEKIQSWENSAAVKDSVKNILFYGNSLTAGYGLDSDEAFPALIQQKLDSLNLDYKVINAGLSGETTAGGLGRLDWILKQPVSIFILELGANDGLRGVPLEETRKNLQSIIDKVRQKDPETNIILAGMQLPPNIGREYTAEFKEIYPSLAEKNDLYLIPFLLEDVAGKPDLNQGDGIHPTAEGQKIVARNVWEILREVISE